MIEDSSNIVQLTTSEVARSLLSFKGKKFSLEGYKPLKEIYDLDPPLMSVKCCRQIGKSVSIGAILTSKGIARPFFNSIYVAPLSIQSSRFSKLYLGPFAESPLVRKYFKDTSSSSNIFMKQFNNGSIIFLSYGQNESDFDRIRGAACDMVAYDEIQDCELDSLPVLYETLAASDYAYKRHYGTAKTELGTLEVLFKRGTGCEWCIKCKHCGKWNVPNTLETCLEMCTESSGPVCCSCKKPIDVEDGKWIAARPSEKDHYSFHIPRHVLSARIDPKKWADLQLAVKTYHPQKLANEVFGLSSGIAGRILSQREAMACCNPSKTAFDRGWPTDGRAIVNVVLGVDWSCTGSTQSFTVATVMGYDYTGKAYMLYTERMNGTDILEQVRRVEQLALLFGAQMVGSDRGVGVLQAGLLRQSLGFDKVVMIQYCAAKQTLRYDGPGGYIAADRTQTMDMVILKMKLGIDKFETPNWESMLPYWKDALALYEEESLSGRRLYRKDEGIPDDWLHSVVFAHVAWMCVSGQFNFLDHLPYQEEDVGFPYN